MKGTFVTIFRVKCPDVQTGISAATSAWRILSRADRSFLLYEIKTCLPSILSPRVVLVYCHVPDYLMQLFENGR